MSDRTRVRSLRERVGGFAIPLGLFIAIGVALWGWNAWRLLRGRATPAVVVSSGVGTSRGRSGTSYHPRVEYRYQVDGAPYVSTRVFPGSGEGRGRDWATEVAARFPLGDSTTAYVDPRDPADAYLVRQPSAGPVLLIAMPLAVIGFLTLGGSAHEDDPVPPPEPTPTGESGRALSPVIEPSQAATMLRRASAGWRRTALALAVAHVALAVVCAVMAGSVTQTIATLWRATMGDGFFVFSFAALGGVGYYMRRRARATSLAAERVREARLLVDRERVHVGEAVTASLHATLNGAPLHGATLRLERETANPRTNKRVHHETVAPLDASPPADAARSPACVAVFALPSASPPSSMAAEESPRTMWAFVATLEFADGHGAELRFPVRVHGASG